MPIWDIWDRFGNACDSFVMALTTAPPENKDEEDATGSSGGGNMKPLPGTDPPLDITPFPLEPCALDMNGNVINGVALPKYVIDQLRMLGMSLNWYTQGELQAAVENSAIDCNVVDDPDGANFYDDLVLDDLELLDDKRDTGIDPCRLNTLNPGHGSVFGEPDENKKNVFFDPQFRERVKWERERRKRNMYAANDDGPSESVSSGSGGGH